MNEWLTSFDLDRWVKVFSTEHTLWAVFALGVAISALLTKNADRAYIAVAIYSFFEFLLSLSYSVYFFQTGIGASPYGGFIVFCRVIIFTMRGLAMLWLIVSLFQVKNGHQ